MRWKRQRCSFTDDTKKSFTALLYLQVNFRKLRQPCVGLPVVDVEVSDLRNDRLVPCPRACHLQAQLPGALHI